MLFYARDDFNYTDLGGRELRAKKNQLVNIRLRTEEKRLKSDELICEVDNEFNPINKMQTNEKTEDRNAMMRKSAKKVLKKVLKKKAVK